MPRRRLRTRHLSARRVVPWVSRVLGLGTGAVMLFLVVIWWGERSNRGTPPGSPEPSARSLLGRLERSLGLDAPLRSAAPASSLLAELAAPAAGMAADDAGADATDDEALLDDEASQDAGISGPVVLTPSARITGRVQRADGSPVSGAALQITPRGLEPSPIEVASDERGEFSIAGVPAGVVAVTASAPGLSSAREWRHVTAAEPAAPLVFTLGAAHTVHGTVRMPDGSPCAGTVHVQGPLRRMATVDAQGNYRIEGLDAGVHELTAICRGAATETRPLAVTTDSRSSHELNWKLKAGFTLSGSVRRRNGQPLVSAAVWSYAVAPPAGASERSKTDAFTSGDGAACRSAARGEFQCGGLRAGWYRISAAFPSGARASSAPVRVGAEANPWVELVMPDAGEVRVRIAEAGGAPRAFTRGVFATGESSSPIPATLRGGSFVFEDLALGRYRIAIGRAASEPSSSAVAIELVRPGQVLDVELRAPEVMAMSGSIVDPDGAPVAGAWVDVSFSEPGLPPLQRAAAPVLSSADGHFEIADLPAGRYAVSARHARGEARALEANAGQHDIRLVLETYGSLSGRVLARDGKPVRRFSVLVFQDTPGEPLAADGDGGRWSLPWVPPGEYRAVVESPSGAASANARVTSGSNTELAVRLDPKPGDETLQTTSKRR